MTDTASSTMADPAPPPAPSSVRPRKSHDAPNSPQRPGLAESLLLSSSLSGAGASRGEVEGAASAVVNRVRAVAVSISRGKGCGNESPPEALVPELPVLRPSMDSERGRELNMRMVPGKRRRGSTGGNDTSTPSSPQAGRL